MAKQQINPDQGTLDLPSVYYESRFLQSHVGRLILNEPKTAIVELIANAWDAGATSVSITWPDGGSQVQIVVADNGSGMSDAEFNLRWRTLSYDRTVSQGREVQFPPGSGAGPTKRLAFGRNGIGRWAGFCFGNTYIVDTTKDGMRNVYRVTKGEKEPFDISRLTKNQASSSRGTRIVIDNPERVLYPAEQIRSEIGMRFNIKKRGSRIRPDFVIVPDGTVGLYSHPLYDDGGEVTADRVAIIELKAPRVKVGTEQKDQCFTYVKELIQKGCIVQGVTRVQCFVIGQFIDSIDNTTREEFGQTVKITPIQFDTVLLRAKSRLLNLHQRVKDAPFLADHRQEIEDFLNPTIVPPSLFDPSMQAGMHLPPTHGDVDPGEGTSQRML